MPMFVSLGGNTTMTLDYNSTNMTMNTTEGAPDPAPNLTDIMIFSKYYESIHGYIAIIVCLFGIFTNTVNIVVLMQPSMRSPTNYLLTALAVADFFTMFFYMPYVLYLNVVSTPDATYPHSYAAIWFILIANNSFITSHSISNWMTVSLAVFRYIAVCHHALSGKLCNAQRAVLTIGIVTLASIVTTFPIFFCYEPEYSEVGYWMTSAPMCTYNGGVIQSVIFWFYGIVIKIVSSILLTTLSGLLVYAMHVANERRHRLLNQGRREESDRTSDHNRTTAMIVAVVLSFVVTETPQGVLALLGGSDSEFFFNTYIHLGDIMDILTLINSSVNFIMYCTMSRKFRETFKKLFVSSCLSKVCHIDNVENNNGFYSPITKQTEQTEL